MPTAPQFMYRDGHTIGQLAAMWEKPVQYVRTLIALGALTTDERGVVTNATLREFYLNHPHPLDE